MEFETLVTGFSFLEAPRVDGDGALYFCDVMLGGIHKRSPDGRIETVFPDRKWIGGLALNADGGLICSGHGGLWLIGKTGEARPLLTEIDGIPVNAINDIQPDGFGGLYFGTIDGASLKVGQPAKPGALYRLDPQGGVTLLWDNIPLSNGMGVSSDGKTLYHSRTFEGLFAYEIESDRSLKNGTLIVPMNDSDGLAVDAEGGIWVAACRSGEVRRYRPNGELDRTLKLPVKEVTSLTFGGDDLCDLYVVTAFQRSLDTKLGSDIQRNGKIFRTRSDIPGLPLAKTRF